MTRREFITLLGGAAAAGIEIPQCSRPRAASSENGKRGCCQ